MKAAPMIVLALTAVAFRPSALPADAQQATQVLPPGLADIIRARERTAAYVVKVKAKYKPQDKEYQTAESLYLDAYSRYVPWIAAVKLAVVEGKSKDLPRDPQYQELTKQAETAAKAFTDHAEKVTVTTKPIPFLRTLFDAGVKFWDFCRKRSLDERKRRAEYFEEATKWKQWDELKPATASSPAASASPSPQ
jgi:hypothetical protein